MPFFSALISHRNKSKVDKNDNSDDVSENRSQRSWFKNKNNRGSVPRKKRGSKASFKTPEKLPAALIVTPESASTCSASVASTIIDESKSPSSLILPLLQNANTQEMDWSEIPYETKIPMPSTSNTDDCQQQWAGSCLPIERNNEQHAHDKIVDTSRSVAPKILFPSNDKAELDENDEDVGNNSNDNDDFFVGTDCSISPDTEILSNEEAEQQQHLQGSDLLLDKGRGLRPEELVSATLFPPETEATKKTEDCIGENPKYDHHHPHPPSEIVTVRNSLSRTALCKSIITKQSDDVPATSSSRRLPQNPVFQAQLTDAELRSNIFRSKLRESESLVASLVQDLQKARKAVHVLVERNVQLSKQLGKTEKSRQQQQQRYQQELQQQLEQYEDTIPISELLQITYVVAPILILVIGPLRFVFVMTMFWIGIEWYLCKYAMATTMAPRKNYSSSSLSTMTSYGGYNEEEYARVMKKVTKKVATETSI